MLAYEITHLERRNKDRKGCQSLLELCLNKRITAYGSHSGPRTNMTCKDEKEKVEVFLGVLCLFF